MANGANGVHLQLREALEDYIKSQYFGKSPILLSAVQNKLDQEGILYQKPYIESSPAYKSELNGIQKSSKLPDWVKAYFDALANADLGVHSSPFCHQVEALEAAFAGKDLFVSTGTGSGKTECFMWPLLAKLAAEARNTPANWSMRGVRTIIMYPMNALVSDQVSRLRRLIGDSEHRFVNVFRETCGEDSRRPQFGMYTGRTPYAGKEPKRSADRSLVATYSEMLNAETDEEKTFLQKLIKDGKFPVKEDFHEFLRKLYDSNHIPDDEDAELVTRFEMQRFCPDILITNYSMLEYMLLRPIESKIWADTQNWLNADSNNKLLFVIDEAHMYRGSAGGEVSFLIRRLFHRLGIDRSRVQFILTTASMPNTATQQPLYSTLPDADDVVAIKGYSNTKMAVRPNQRIIMLNKGIGDKGFTICCDCGAAMPGDDPSVLKDIMRPYRSKFLRTRCKHNETKNVNLGYDFITDMLVLEIALDRQQVSMDLAKNSWLNRAGQSLAEALRLSACQELDIEFTELVTGFRVRQNQKGDFIDIYLYDSLSSGAGYAVSIEASIQQLLIKTRELLSSCTCDSACHKCLKHYRNQYVHGLLDRSAALDLLTWAEKGVRSPMLPVYEQRNLLQSVEQILQFSGVHIDFNHEPIEAKSFHGRKRIVVYPAMWARPTEKNMVFVSDSYLKYAKPYALKTIVGGL